MIPLKLSFAAAFTSITVIAGPVDFQKPPTKMPADMPVLSPLLNPPQFGEIKASSQWAKQREAYRAQWMKLLGDFPTNRAPLKAEFGTNEDVGTFTRQYVCYQIEDGVFTDGYLLKPKKAERRLPAIIVFHPTTPLQAKGVAGLSKDYPEEKWQGVQLVQRDYVVWCPRNFIFDDQPGKKETDRYLANVKALKARHPNWTSMGRMTFDAIRAADFVESLPEVDKSRIGCIGHSLGGKQAVYAAAFDDRYKVAVSSEGGIGLKFSNWEAPWYFGDVIRKPSFALENHQALSLVAPRAFLLLAGNSADTDKSWAFIEAVMPVYKLLGASENIGWFNHGLGHRYPSDARKVAEEFLDKHLKQSR